ncbi:MAG: histidine kinase [Rhodocyclales bacterium]|nr:histidine kinase [Rhodocyclales bacterium]
MESIKQKPETPVPQPRLPDFRSLGVLLRTLMLVNLLAFATVLIAEREPVVLEHALILMAGYLELPLFVAVLVLYVVYPVLARWPLRAAYVAVQVVAVAVTALSFSQFGDGATYSLWRWLVWAVIAASICLLYFDYRGRRYSPALTEARLMALTLRIQPHFLFNSLNAVLGVMRSDPRRAEQVLEELADLFRVLMKDNRELVPLGDELTLCERYLDIEQLRLGDRLQVQWSLDDCPRDALVPPFMLQPLLENAIYHGVEPCGAPSGIVVKVSRHAGEVRIEVDNPIPEMARNHGGNHMALNNIRERLTLFFDLEGSLEATQTDGRYRVVIRLPYRRKPA